MKTRLIAFFIIIISPTWLWSSQKGDEITAYERMEKYYDACIEKLISNCQAKLFMGNSRHENMRRSAALYCLKAGFLRFHKSELIRDMMARDVGIKQYRICYYLNKRFFDLFSDAIRTVNLEYLLKAQE